MMSDHQNGKNQAKLKPEIAPSMQVDFFYKFPHFYNLFRRLFIVQY